MVVLGRNSLYEASNDVTIQVSSPLAAARQILGLVRALLQRALLPSAAKPSATKPAPIQNLLRTAAGSRIREMVKAVRSRKRRGKDMLRRIVLVLAAILIIGVLTAFILIRVIVFGGTPTIHRTASQPLLAASPCATISTSSGQRAFSIQSQMSNASYEAHFQAAGQTLPGTVMGVTGDVSGEFLLTSDASPTIMSMKIMVDLRTLDSGAPERDGHVRNDTFETNKYPYAIFTVSDAQLLPGGYTEGQMVTFKLKGDLTLHGVTRPATFDMQGKLQGNTATGSGTTLVHLQDYQMQPPQTTSVVTITVSKDVTLTINFTAQRENCTHLS